MINIPEQLQRKNTDILMFFNGHASTGKMPYLESTYIEWNINMDIDTAMEYLEHSQLSTGKTVF